MRRFAFGCLLSSSLFACSALLGDFTVGPGSGPEIPDGSNGETGANRETGAPDTGVTDGPGPDAPKNAKDEVLALAANSLATCATIAYDFQTPTEKVVTYCWGAAGNPIEFLGAEPGDPLFSGMVRPKAVGTNPPEFLTFDKLAGSAKGLAFQGRSGPLSPKGANVSYCWGSNGQAECGLAATSTNVAPTPLGVASTFPRVDAIGMGPYHGCFVSQHKLYCWGQNNQCEVTSGAAAGCAAPNNFQRTVVDEANTIVGSGNYEFDLFAGGQDHSCVISRKGGQTIASVQCWGRNAENQCGQGTTVPFVDNPSTVLDATFGLNLTFGEYELGAGTFHTCAIAAKKALYCWGKNDKSQAAPTNPASVTGPAEVALPSSFGNKLSGLAVGGDVSCLIAAPVVGPDAGIGTAVCFGDKAGPLGRLAANQNDAFAPVSGIKDVQAIGVGGAHACAIAVPANAPPGTHHGLFCWGANDGKQVDPNDPRAQISLAHPVSFPPKP